MHHHKTASPLFTPMLKNLRYSGRLVFFVIFSCKVLGNTPSYVSLQN